MNKKILLWSWLLLLTQNVKIQAMDQQDPSTYQLAELPTYEAVVSQTQRETRELLEKAEALERLERVLEVKRLREERELKEKALEAKRLQNEAKEKAEEEAQKVAALKAYEKRQEWLRTGKPEWLRTARQEDEASGRYTAAQIQDRHMDRACSGESMSMRLMRKHTMNIMPFF